MLSKFRKVVDKITTFFLELNKPEINIPCRSGSSYFCSIKLDRFAQIETICFKKCPPFDFTELELGKEYFDRGMYFYVLSTKTLSGKEFKSIEISSPRPVKMSGEQINRLKEFISKNLTFLEFLKYVQTD